MKSYLIYGLERVRGKRFRSKVRESKTDCLISLGFLTFDLHVYDQRSHVASVAPRIERIKTLICLNVTEVNADLLRNGQRLVYIVLAIVRVSLPSS